MLHAIKRLFNKGVINAMARLFGVHVYRQLPRGVSVTNDLLTLEGLQFRVIFDVGANIGQSTIEMLRAFRGATIYSFEPSKRVYEQLSLRFQGNSRVKCFNIALGSLSGHASLQVHVHSTRSRIVSNRGARDTETVVVDTLESICLQRDIGHINFLKIDAEGHDFEVLKGAEGMLRAQAIDLLQIEASMNPVNQDHVGIGEFYDFLIPRGYLLFGIYEQWPQPDTRNAYLRRSNLVFISESAAELVRLGNS